MRRDELDKRNFISDPITILRYALDTVNTFPPRRTGVPHLAWRGGITVQVKRSRRVAAATSIARSEADTHRHILGRSHDQLVDAPTLERRLHEERALGELLI